MKLTSSRGLGNVVEAATINSRYNDLVKLASGMHSVPWGFDPSQGKSWQELQKARGELYDLFGELRQTYPKSENSGKGATPQENIGNELHYAANIGSWKELFVACGNLADWLWKAKDVTSLRQLDAKINNVSRWLASQPSQPEKKVTPSQPDNQVMPNKNVASKGRVVVRMAAPVAAPAAPAPAAPAPAAPGMLGRIKNWLGKKPAPAPAQPAQPEQKQLSQEDQLIAEKIEALQEQIGSLSKLFEYAEHFKSRLNAESDKQKAYLEKDYNVNTEIRFIQQDVNYITSLATQTLDGIKEGLPPEKTIYWGSLAQDLSRRIEDMEKIANAGSFNEKIEISHKIAKGFIKPLHSMRSLLMYLDKLFQQRRSKSDPYAAFNIASNKAVVIKVAGFNKKAEEGDYDYEADMRSSGVDERLEKETWVNQWLKDHPGKDREKDRPEAYKAYEEHKKSKK